MNREDIIRMAREAGFPCIGDQPIIACGREELERFAALVAAEIGIAQHRRGYESGLRDGAAAATKEANARANKSWTLMCEKMVAAERNKVAAWMIERSYATGHGDTIEDLLVELEWQVKESERNSWPAEMEAMERQVNILTDALAQAKADEREACAKFFESHWREEWTDEQIVEAIRARQA